MKAAGEDLGAGADHAVGLRSGDVELRLAVREQQLESRAAHRRDAPGRVDGVGRHLSAEPAVAANFRHGARHRAHHADLDRRRLRPEHAGERRNAGHGDGGL